MNNTQPGLQTAVSRCLWLLAVTLVLLVLFAGPAWWLAGMPGIVGLTLASVLCFVPGCLAFALGSLGQSTQAQAPLLALAGTGIRLLFVLGGYFVVRSARPDLGFREFTVWLLLFYLAMLLAETWLVTRGVESAGTVGRGTN